MPTLHVLTEIHQTKQVVFDLSRSINLHMHAAKNTNEKAILGRTSGLILLDEIVTWGAVHFGIKQKLTSKITEFNPYFTFTDEMIKGIFKSFHHQHLFTEKDKVTTTTMEDILSFESPLRILGKIANWLFLKEYLTQFLKERNAIIKSTAESDKWLEFLPLNP